MSGGGGGGQKNHVFFEFYAISNIFINKQKFQGV